MDSKPKSYERISRLINRGVRISHPETVVIGEEVDIDRISGKGVVIYPGCRIYGSKTVISSDCRLGAETPLTIENCLLARGVELKGGFAANSVFLEKANMGSGAHVREGCILEEEAGGAHCVGLKQTILFPFVTLGSLINFCDCLMAGGTSRRNHSEVGSSYIHFNFTPDADKATPSLLGDVTRGVMLREPPIFLGGQGGMVGPLRLGYGNVVAAGSILRHDYLNDNQLIFEKALSNKVKDYTPAAYPHFARIVKNNILYLANLVALESWYTFVRKIFLEIQPFGLLLYAGVLEQLAAAKKERLKRLKDMVEKAVPSGKKGCSGIKMSWRGKIESFEAVFNGGTKDIAAETVKFREDFLDSFEKVTAGSKTNYLTAIQNLPAAISDKGVIWLGAVVEALTEKVA